MTLEPTGCELVQLLRCNKRAVRYIFDEDADDVMASQLPPLLDNKFLFLQTIPADGDKNTGGRVWQSAPEMCRWLKDNAAAAVVGRRVLDLGSGTGAVGIYCAGLVAAGVVLSDGGPVDLLDLQKSNVRANSGFIDASTTTVEVRHLAFGCFAHLLPSGPFDLVLGSDIIYDASAHAALCRTLRALWLRDQPRMILATMPRGRASLEPTLEGPGSESPLPLYTESTLAAFTREASLHGLGVRPLKGSAQESFEWTAAAFRAATAFLLEVVATDGPAAVLS